MLVALILGSAGVPALATPELTESSFRLRNDLPRILFAGDLHWVNVAVENRSDATWRHRYRVSYSFEPQAPNSRSRGITENVAPGSTTNVVIPVQVPRRLGLFELRWEVSRPRRLEPFDPVTESIVVLPARGLLVVLGASFLLAASMFFRQRHHPDETTPPPGSRRERIAVAGIAVACALLGWSDIAQRQQPTIFGDEMKYLAHGRNLAHYGTPYAPDPVHAVESDTAPFYGFFLAPIYLFSDDHDTVYKAALWLGMFLHLSMLLPTWFLANRLFPRFRWMICWAIGLWSVPIGSRLAVMSEALFTPLFVWVLALFVWTSERPTTRRSALFGLAVAATLLTRLNGVVLLPIVAAATLVRWNGARPRMSRLSELGATWSGLAIPGLAWALLAWARTRQMYADRHTVVDYTERLGEAGINYLHYPLVFWNQLAYLNLASLNLLAVLITVLFARAITPADPARLKPSTTWRRPILGSMRFDQFLLLSAGGIVLSSVVYMVRPDPVERYLMYGRYVDPIVPLCVLFGIGSLSYLPRLRRDFRSLLVGTFGAGITWAFFASLPEGIGEPRMINLGGAWLKALLATPDFSIPKAIAAAVAVLAALLLGQHRLRWLTIVALLLVCSFNTHAVVQRHVLHESRESDTTQAIRRLDGTPARVFYFHRQFFKVTLFRAQHYLAEQVEIYRPGESKVDLDRDFLVGDGELVPARLAFADEQLLFDLGLWCQTEAGCEPSADAASALSDSRALSQQRAEESSPSARERPGL